MTHASNHQGIAVVTGAAGGMGAHIARRLHADGHRVLLTDIDVEAAEVVARVLSSDGSTARATELDVAHRANFVTALEHVEELWGTPTIVVNNAAITKTADLMTVRIKAERQGPDCQLNLRISWTDPSESRPETGTPRISS